jgi:GlpG protein
MTATNRIVYGLGVGRRAGYKRWMRPIGNLPDENQARLFGDYLLAKGVRNEVEADSDGSWIIWVLDDEQQEAGRGMLDAFRANPTSEEFSSKAADADRVRVQEEQSEAAWRRRVHNRRRVFPGAQSHGAGILTYALVVACVVVTMLCKFGDNEEVLAHLIISLPGDGFLPEVRNGEIWRLITPILLHFSFAHIFFNLMWLFSLGSMIESIHGSGRFVLVVLVLGIGSNLAQYAWGSSPVFGGMSGVNYGLIGYVWIRGRFDPGSGLHIDRQNLVLAIVFFFLCFTGWVGPIANYAHAGGLVLGMAWGWITAQMALKEL